MPNYKYMCNECGCVEILTLRMDSNPKLGIPCKECRGLLMRKIIGSNSIKVERETLGKWYKDKTGKKLLGDI